MKRLSIPLNESEHQAIKLAAMLQGQSIKEYILSKLFASKNIPNEETLKAMRNIEENNNLSSYTAESFLEELKDIDGKYRR